MTFDHSTQNNSCLKYYSKKITTKMKMANTELQRPGSVLRQSEKVHYIARTLELGVSCKTSNTLN